MSNDAKYIAIVRIQAKMWKTIFSLAQMDDVEFSKPLTPKILSDPNHPFVKTLIYIYSMQSFVFSELNKASRMKDESKIKFYGAFASALGFIVHSGNLKNTNLEKEFTAYRGLTLPREELNDKYKEGKKINIQGFTSTTLSMERGLNFCFSNLKPEEVSGRIPVFFEITFKGDNQFFYLNSDEYSSYPYEEEVLVQEGIMYLVNSVEE